MTWLIFFNLLLRIVFSQTCGTIGMVSTRLEPTQQELSFKVQTQAGNDLQSFHFVGATLDEMNLNGPIASGMRWWTCAADTIPPVLHAISGVKGCIIETNGCWQSSFAGVKWEQIQEGRMFWFLLVPDETAEDEEDKYTLSSTMQMTWLDASTNTNVTIDDIFTTTLDVTELDELGIIVPTMDIRVTNYEIGAISNGRALLLLEMELYLSDETMWDLLPNEPIVLESEETAFNLDEAVITKLGNDDRSWQAVLSVSVCDLSGPQALTIVKPVLDQAVQYDVSSSLEIDMQSACPQFSPIGDLPTTSSSTVYSDSSYTIEATDFYLGDTVYVCSTISSEYGTLASVSFDSLSITQSTTKTDLTSQTTELSTSVVSTGNIEICISFPLPEALGSSPVGLESTVSTTYSLTYTDPSTGRRLLSTDLFDSPELSLNIRSSGCTYPNGKVAKIGDFHRLPCTSGYGVETRKCERHQWEMVEGCSLSYFSQLSLSRLQTGLCVFSVLTACYFSSRFFSDIKVGKD